MCGLLAKPCWGKSTTPSEAGTVHFQRGWQSLLPAKWKLTPPALPLSGVAMETWRAVETASFLSNVKAPLLTGKLDRVPGRERGEVCCVFSQNLRFQNRLSIYICVYIYIYFYLFLYSSIGMVLYPLYNLLFLFLRVSYTLQY